MKQKKPLETAATIFLGVVCAGLFLRLALRVRSVDAGGPQQGTIAEAPHSARSRVTAVALGGAASAFPDGPALNVDLYRRLLSEPLAAPDRDPFSFGPTPQEIQQAQRARQAASAAAPPGPPPPPPLPFKAVGYSQKAQGQLEAYLTDSQEIYVVHAGEIFDKDYRVIKITPAMIQIEDESLHQTVEMPFPR